MRSYQTGIEYYFREIGQKLPAGSVVELRPGDAERYMTSHPGLLRPLPVTAQARQQAVRSGIPADEPAPAAGEAPAVDPVTADVVTDSTATPEPTSPVADPAPAAVEAEQITTPAADVSAAPAAASEEKPKGKGKAKK